MSTAFWCRRIKLTALISSHILFNIQNLEEELDSGIVVLRPIRVKNPFQVHHSCFLLLEIGPSCPVWTLNSINRMRKILRIHSAAFVEILLALMKCMTKKRDEGQQVQLCWTLDVLSDAVTLFSSFSFCHVISATNFFLSFSLLLTPEILIHSYGAASYPPLDYPVLSPLLFYRAV